MLDPGGIGRALHVPWRRCRTRQRRGAGQGCSEKERPARCRRGGGSVCRRQHDETCGAQTRIELETDYGKLLIPIADIERIDFGLRLSDETRQEDRFGDRRSRVHGFPPQANCVRRTDRSQGKILPGLGPAAAGKDVEASRRAQEIVDKMREALANDESLDIPPHDVIHTAHSKIAGKIAVESFQVTTKPFGDQQAKLADMRSLRAQGGSRSDLASAESISNILPDPGTPHMYANRIGQTLSFRVTGPQPAAAAQQGIFGSDVYTMDSSLAGAALHAGTVPQARQPWFV